jgi:hypothetical protein
MFRSPVQITGSDHQFRTGVQNRGSEQGFRTGVRVRRRSDCATIRCMERLGSHRQGLVIVSVIFVAGASVWLLAARARSQVVRAGFWFENVTFDATEVEADRLGGGVTPVEMKTIERVAMAEVRAAFAGWRIAISADPGAPFKVRVAQELRHPLYLRYPGPAGESAGLWPLGGQGAVNFRLLASNAIRHSPPSADRAAKIQPADRVRVSSFRWAYRPDCPIPPTRRSSCEACRSPSGAARRDRLRRACRPGSMRSLRRTW